MIEDSVLEGYKQLACAILYNAVKHWQTRQEPTDEQLLIMEEFGYTTTNDELVSFFQSEWCIHLCLCADIAYEAMLKELGIPNPEYPDTQDVRAYRTERGHDVR